MSATLPAVDERSALLDRVLVTAFLENFPDYVYFKDRTGRFIAVSQSLVRYFGRGSVDDLIGRTDFDFWTPRLAREGWEDEQQIIRTGQPILGKLEQETRPDGTPCWLLTNKMPLRNAAGEIIGTFGISKDVTKAKEVEDDLEETHRELLDASRVAGMAEVATGVLHNVGNVLNSLNVSASVLAAGARQSKTETLGRVAALLREHERAGDLATFLTTDPKGKLVGELLASLGRNAVEQRSRLLQEVAGLQKNIDHIKEIVAMQQSYATLLGVIEPLDPVLLLDDALRMNSGALNRHDVRVERDYKFTPPVLAEKGKVLQILVNLIRNAKYACDEGARGEKSVTLRLRATVDGTRVQFIVEDNGVGIPAENLTRIFQHGFTTRKTGHGFGLHSAANAARELKGSLTVASAGPGTGATFTLELPAAGTSVPPP